VVALRGVGVEAKRPMGEVDVILLDVFGVEGKHAKLWMFLLRVRDAAAYGQNQQRGDTLHALTVEEIVS
jgi:hypothetical protein